MTFKFNISKRIAVGYLVILSVASIASLVSILRLQHNTRHYKEISNVYLPSISYLKEFDAVSREAHKLIFNWIYISNKDEKERLKIIHAQEYPDLKFKMVYFNNSIQENAQLKKEQLELLQQQDTILAYQKKIMSNLVTAQQYGNDAIVDASISTFENEILPRYNTNQLYLKNILKTESDYLKGLEFDLDKSFDYLTLTMISMLIVIIVIGVIATYLGTRNIATPIKNLKKIIARLSKGEMPQVTTTARQDEIGEMTNAISKMIENVNAKAEFATQTGMGNYDADFNLLSNQDILGLALVQMRSNLQQNSRKISDEDWVRKGMIKAAEILRINKGGASEMYANIINFIAQYVDAYCGVLFITKEGESDNLYLEAAAGYAINMEQYGTKNLAFGESLAGQAALDKRTIVINGVPEGFIKISSGLGEAPAKHLIIVPLIFDGKVKGVIELAGTASFTALHIELLEKTSRNIAIAFDIVERESRMENLLSESKQLNKKLKANEIELKTANDELNTFVYRASHDLKGPLTSILGVVNVASIEQPDKTEAGYLKMIGESANKLDKILSSLIKTMSVKDEVLKVDKIDFRSMLQTLLQDLKKQTEAQRTIFTTNIELDESFHSDYDILSYALHSIIENAIKFQNNSLPESYVLIGVYSIDGGVKINVSDNGVGIKKGIQGRLFEMFFRGNSKTEGSGLGLYIVNKVIKKLGGRIEFNSQEGTGTFVSIFLPNLSEEMYERGETIAKGIHSEKKTVQING